MPVLKRMTTKTKQKSGAKKTAKDMALRDLLVTKLKGLYDVEQQLTKALPKMAKGAADPELKEGFEKHLKQTEGHVSRLEKILDAMGEKVQKLECDGIRGIVADGDWIIKNTEGDAATDAALAAAAQYAEHYEMAGYGSAIAWAKMLGEDEAADTLQETFNEEKQTSEELMDLAKNKLDERANSVSDENNESDNESVESVEIEEVEVE
jgi:ferritin-like metal-binding protein YciE